MTRPSGSNRSASAASRSLGATFASNTSAGSPPDPSSSSRHSIAPALNDAATVPV